MRIAFSVAFIGLLSPSLYAQSVTMEDIIVSARHTPQAAANLPFNWATLDDGDSAMTVANRGLAEVDAVPEADGTTSLAVTLLRAVGWLSRGDLRLRPGDAGPGLATPGAFAQAPEDHPARLHSRGR